MRNVARVQVLNLLTAIAAFLTGSLSSNGGDPPLEWRIEKLIRAGRANHLIQDSGLMVKNPLADNDVPRVVDQMKEAPNSSSYHLLIAIRRYYPLEYEKLQKKLKASILCSALNNQIFLNDWGNLAPPGSFDGDSAKALLEIGKDAIEFLVPILNEDKEAPLAGSKCATIAKVYQYRRKDYAYRYAAMIMGREAPFHLDPQERDVHIRTLKKLVVK